jgi:hypothetical protein
MSIHHPSIPHGALVELLVHFGQALNDLDKESPKYVLEEH